MLGCLTTLSGANWRDFGNPFAPDKRMVTERWTSLVLEVQMATIFLKSWGLRVLSFFKYTGLSSSFKGTCTIFSKKWVQRLYLWGLGFSYSKKLGIIQITLTSNSSFRWPLNSHKTLLGANHWVGVISSSNNHGSAENGMSPRVVSFPVQWFGHFPLKHDYGRTRF